MFFLLMSKYCGMLEWKCLPNIFGSAVVHHSQFYCSLLLCGISCIILSDMLIENVQFVEQSFAKFIPLLSINTYKIDASRGEFEATACCFHFRS